MKKILCAALAATMLCGSANAAEVLDQSFQGSGTTAALIDNNGAGDGYVQTVTAGLSGVLSTIWIGGNHAPFSGFNILATIGGLPTSVVLGTASLVGTSGIYDIFSSSLTVVAGDVFGLQPYTSGSSSYIFWSGGTAGGYTGGAAYFEQSGVYSIRSTLDLNFRTYVTVPDAVPEPASWTMMLAGFGIIGAAMRRRQVNVRFA